MVYNLDLFQKQKRMKTIRLKTTQLGFIKHPILLCLVLGGILYTGFQVAAHHASAATPVIKSGISGYCLDIHDNETATNTPIDSWHCNGTPAQAWKVTGSTITHD